MTQQLSAAQRSYIMSCIRGKDTAPELVVRRLVYALGYRYRLHKRSLPGCPDLVFASRRKVIFVHGCFWHHHRCQEGRLPRLRPEYWKNKLEGNVRRDRKQRRRLSRIGWSALTIW